MDSLYRVNRCVLPLPRKNFDPQQYNSLDFQSADTVNREKWYHFLVPLSIDWPHDELLRMWGTRIGSMPGLNLAWRSLATSSFTQSSPHWNYPNCRACRCTLLAVSYHSYHANQNAAIWVVWNNSTWSWIHMEKESTTFAEECKEKAFQKHLLLPVNELPPGKLGKQQLETVRLTCMVRMDAWPAYEFSGTGPQASSHPCILNTLEWSSQDTNMIIILSITHPIIYSKIKSLQTLAQIHVYPTHNLYLPLSPSLPWYPLYSLYSAQHNTACTNIEHVHPL